MDRVHEIALMEVAYDAGVPDFQFAWGDNDPIEDLDDDEPNDTDNNEDDDTDGPEPLDGPEPQLLPETEPVDENPQEEGAHSAHNVGALDAQEEEAHGAEERHETELVDSMETEETQIPQHYNLRGNKIDYEQKDLPQM
jgi:hypothetical protein